MASIQQLIDAIAAERQQYLDVFAKLNGDLSAVNAQLETVKAQLAALQGDQSGAIAAAVEKALADQNAALDSAITAVQGIVPDDAVPAPTPEPVPAPVPAPVPDVPLENVPVG